jgi:hypothetical protein
LGACPGGEIVHLITLAWFMYCLESFLHQAGAKKGKMSAALERYDALCADIGGAMVMVWRSDRDLPRTNFSKGFSTEANLVIGNNTSRLLDVTAMDNVGGYDVSVDRNDHRLHNVTAKRKAFGILVKGNNDQVKDIFVGTTYRGIFLVHDISNTNDDSEEVYSGARNAFQSSTVRRCRAFASETSNFIVASNTFDATSSSLIMAFRFTPMPVLSKTELPET